MKIKIFTLFIYCVVLFGCTKLVSVSSPQNQLTPDKVFSDSTSATAALVSIYASFNVSVDPNYNKCMGLYTDEMDYYLSTQDFIDFYQGKINLANTDNLNIWSSLYFAVYQCNDLIAQVNKGAGLSQTLTTNLSNEAKFLRAYAYFYLVTTYGHVPLLLTTNAGKNAVTGQVDSSEIFQQIIADLKDAENGLPAAYPDDQKVRANKFAASAMLDRVYLYLRDWKDAEIEATLVINSGLYTPLESLSSVFLANSQETILSFWTQNGFIYDADNLIPDSGVPQFPVTAQLLGAFDSGDLRRTTWIDSILVGLTVYYFPYKYHNRDQNNSTPEYLVALRAGEQYLIRSEAEANGAGGGLNAAFDDLNIIRNRAGLAPYNGPIQTDSLLVAIYHERQVELFMENGNRFLDLKRTGRIDAVMSGYKPLWNSSSKLLPIPQSEITYDHNLLQNPGY